MTIAASRLPDLVFGAGAIGEIGALAAALGSGRPALIVADRFLQQTGAVDAILARLAEKGVAASAFSDFAGEPKAKDIAAPVATARREGAGLVIGLGGGSALDIAKIVACCAAGEADPGHYALAANPLPGAPLAKILIPTTAGTGSEANGIAVFAADSGKKLWLYGPEAKPDIALLDPELTLTLPPNLTAWCGMDALVHAFESATSRRTNRIAELYSHKALSLICGALERAVRQPDDIGARGDMLLGAFYAGFAIENTGTGMGHCISHALAALGQVHHGHATALAFEATLPWVAGAGGPAMGAAAAACGLAGPEGLADFASGLMDRIGVERRLPPAFARVTPAGLAREMSAPENRPMLKATPRTAKEADIDRLANLFLHHVGDGMAGAGR